MEHLPKIEEHDDKEQMKRDLKSLDRNLSRDIDLLKEYKELYDIVKLAEQLADSVQKKIEEQQ